MRYILLILTLGLGQVDLVFPTNQAGEGQASFSEAIRITDTQATLLRRAAEEVDQLVKTSKTSLSPLEARGSFPQAREALLTYVDHGASRVEAIQTEFGKLVTSQPVARASEIYFGDIRNYYVAVRTGLKNLEKPDQTNYAKPRNNAIWVLEHNASAYWAAANNGSLTFDLGVGSEPRGASVSFKKKGDPYTPHQDPTNTVIKNLVYAVWYVQVRLDGYEDQEKQHDATREERHELDFKLKPKP